MRTALRAMRLGVEGPEPFYFRATSIDSIHKRPLDPASIKELLARSSLDAGRNHELSRALFDGLSDEDRDLSDFAAQGLSRIENRYQEAIKEEEQQLASEGSPGDVSRLAELLLDFAEIQWFDRTLRSFYIGRALTLLDEKEAGGEVSGEPRRAKLRIRGHIMQGLLDKAEELIESFSFESDPEVLLMEAHLAFLKRDVAAVAALMRRLLDQEINEETKELIATWLREEG